MKKLLFRMSVKTLFVLSIVNTLFTFIYVIVNYTEVQSPLLFLNFFGWLIGGAFMYKYLTSQKYAKIKEVSQLETAQAKEMRRVKLNRSII